MLIERCGLKRDALTGKTVLLTGAGGGIGLEAARALVWLGATVLLAEIDEKKGSAAALAINNELGGDRAFFYHIDIADEKQIDAMCSFIHKNFGFLDVIFNNATITPLGAVDEVDVGEWDKSYAVNLRAPLLLTQRFLPDMKEKNCGTIVFVPSSGAAPFMGAYEVFKTSQVELCNTLYAELEESNIHVYSIGPGLVKTDTALAGIRLVASKMGISNQEFLGMNEKHMLDAEAAGTGFALSVVFAEKYRGQEIGSIQVLTEMGMNVAKGEDTVNMVLSGDDEEALKKSIAGIAATYEQQYEGWLKRSLFERQWVLRDLKKVMKTSADQVRDMLQSFCMLAEKGDFDALKKEKELLLLLKTYYEHQLKLLQGYEKDPEKLIENTGIIQSWIDETEKAVGLLS